MCPEGCYLFITGKRIPGYSNVAMPCDGGVYTYSISKVQRLTNEPMGLQSIQLSFKYLNLSFSTVHLSSIVEHTVVSCHIYCVHYYKNVWRESYVYTYTSIYSCMSSILFSEKEY